MRLKFHEKVLLLLLSIVLTILLSLSIPGFLIVLFILLSTGMYIYFEWYKKALGYALVSVVEIENKLSIAGGMRWLEWPKKKKLHHFSPEGAILMDKYISIKFTSRALIILSILTFNLFVVGDLGNPAVWARIF